MNRMTMKKIISVSAAMLLAAGLIFCFARSGEAKAEAPTLVVTGTLEQLDTSQTPAVMALNVNGQLASAPVTELCQYTDDRGNPMKQDDFVKRYLKKFVTVTLYEHNGEIVSCVAK